MERLIIHLANFVAVLPDLESEEIAPGFDVRTDGDKEVALLLTFVEFNAGLPLIHLIVSNAALLPKGNVKVVDGCFEGVPIDIEFSTFRVIVNTLGLEECIELLVCFCAFGVRALVLSSAPRVSQLDNVRFYAFFELILVGTEDDKAVSLNHLICIGASAADHEVLSVRPGLDFVPQMGANFRIGGELLRGIVREMVQDPR